MKPTRVRLPTINAVVPIVADHVESATPQQVTLVHAILAGATDGDGGPNNSLPGCTTHVGSSPAGSALSITILAWYSPRAPHPPEHLRDRFSRIGSYERYLRHLCQATWDIYAICGSFSICGYSAAPIRLNTISWRRRRRRFGLATFSSRALMMAPAIKAASSRVRSAALFPK